VEDFFFRHGVRIRRSRGSRLNAIGRALSPSGLQNKRVGYPFAQSHADAKSMQELKQVALTMSSLRNKKGICKYMQLAKNIKNSEYL
jgi:hypothetical protein